MKVEEGDNFTLSSSKADLRLDDEDLMVAPEWEIFLTVVLLTSSCVGAILNTGLLVLFIRRRGFRTLSNRFVINLSAANLTCNVLLVPLSLVEVLAQEVPGMRLPLSIYSMAYCTSLTAFTTLSSVSMLLATLFIGLDQYLAVLDPLHYHRHVTRSRVYWLALLGWVVSAVSCLAMILDPTDTITYYTWSKTCKMEKDDHPFSIYRLAICIGMILLVYIIPFIFISVTYIRIFCAARGNSVRTRRNSVSSSRRNSVSSVCGKPYLTVPTVSINGHLGHVGMLDMGQVAIIDNNNSALNKARIARSPSIRSNGMQLASSITNLKAAMKEKITNASTLLLYREETRAARVTVLVVLMIAICWGPYIASIVIHTGYFSSEPPAWLHMVSILFLNLYACISPLLYAYRSKRVQRDVRKVLGIKPKDKDDNKFRMKSFSCPQLILTSCNSAPGTGANTAQMKAYSDEQEQTGFTWESRDIANEGTPCIQVTLCEPRTSLDSGYDGTPSPRQMEITGHQNNDDISSAVHEEQHLQVQEEDGIVIPSTSLLGVPNT